MNKVTNIFIFAVLSVVVMPTAIFADYQSGTTAGANPNSRQGQLYSNQAQGNSDSYRPNMSAENSAMRGASNRYDRSNQENQTMIKQDHDMVREGYDANDKYYHSNQGQFGQFGQQHGNQEQMMRGEGSYSNQGEYSSKGYGNGYQQYQGNANAQHPTYEYRLGKDGKWHDTKDDNMGFSNQTGAQVTPESYPLNENYPNADQSSSTTSSSIKKTNAQR